MDREARVKSVTQGRHVNMLISTAMNDDFFMCLLGALVMLVMMACVPLVLYWLWTGQLG